MSADRLQAAAERSELLAPGEAGSDSFTLPGADGGGLEAGHTGNGMPNNLVKGLTLHQPWYQREQTRRTAERRVCANGCLETELVHHCATCRKDLCEACGTKHASDDSTKQHVLRPYNEKKVGDWRFYLCICMLVVFLNVRMFPLYRPSVERSHASARAMGKSWSWPAGSQNAYLRFALAVFLVNQLVDVAFENGGLECAHHVGPWDAR